LPQPRVTNALGDGDRLRFNLRATVKESPIRGLSREAVTLRHRRA